MSDKKKIFIFAPADETGECHRQLEAAGCEIEPNNTSGQANDFFALSIGGAMKAGSTQQTLNMVIISARWAAGKVRATITISATLKAPPPKPWMNRATSSTYMLGASAASSSPTPNRTSPARSGTDGPTRSLSRPARTVLNNIPTRKSENSQE